jgi:hypothetical protein
MVRDVKTFIRSCGQCQRAKIDTQGKLGFHQPLELPSSPWESVAMDLITGFPTTSSKTNSILVVVDRFSKRARFLP